MSHAGASRKKLNYVIRDVSIQPIRIVDLRITIDPIATSRRDLTGYATTNRSILLFARSFSILCRLKNHPFCYLPSLRTIVLLISWIGNDAAIRKPACPRHQLIHRTRIQSGPTSISSLVEVRLHSLATFESSQLQELLNKYITPIHSRCSSAPLCTVSFLIDR